MERRKGFLGASEIFTWREVEHPKWWSDKRHDILAEKFDGVAKEFDYKTQISINHGAFSEEDVAMKFGDGIGFKVETANDQFINSRWPCIAATTDGYIHTDHDSPSGINDIGPSYCQDPGVFPELRRSIAGRGTGLLELKRSVSVAWQKYVPKYYIPQVMTQLAVLEMPWAVICADTIMKDGYRQYWDMRPYLIEFNPNWNLVLDKVNAEFLLQKERRA